MAVTHRMLVRLATNQVRIERKIDLILRGLHPQLSMAGKNCVLCGTAQELKVVDDLPCLVCTCKAPHPLDRDFVDSLQPTDKPKNKEKDDAAIAESETEDFTGAGRTAGRSGPGSSQNG